MAEQLLMITPTTVTLSRLSLSPFVVTGLERRWEDWTDADPSDLFHGAVNASVKFYSFPESRLERATDYYGSSRRKPRALARG